MECTPRNVLLVTLFGPLLLLVPLWRGVKRALTAKTDRS